MIHDEYMVQMQAAEQKDSSDEEIYRTYICWLEDFAEKMDVRDKLWLYDLLEAFGKGPREYLDHLPGTDFGGG